MFFLELVSWRRKRFLVRVITRANVQRLAMDNCVLSIVNNTDFFCLRVTTRHVTRVLERGLHFAGGLGELVCCYPRKFLNLRWRIPQNLMISFNCQRNFGFPNIFCSWRKCQISSKRHSQSRSSMHWTFEIHGYYLWWYCSVEWFGRVWKVWGRWEE